MPRPSKKTELIPMEKPSMLPEDYVDRSSALIQLGSMMWQKNNKMLTDGGEGSSESLPLSLEQVQYLNMLINGIEMEDACRALKISIAQPILWEKENDGESLFKYCSDAIMEIGASRVEKKMWNKIMQDPESCKGNLLMFGMKAFMEKYRDNAPVTNVPVQVNISIDGQAYQAEAKMVGEDDA